MKHKITSENNNSKKEGASIHGCIESSDKMIQLKEDYQHSIKIIQSMNTNNSFDGILEQLMTNLEMLNRTYKEKH